MKNPILGTYRHFKGGLYKLLGVALHSETKEKLAIYKRIGTNKLWARPLKMFMEVVEQKGKRIPRFKYFKE
jgi:hypothetical protein